MEERLSIREWISLLGVGLLAACLAALVLVIPMAIAIDWPSTSVWGRAFCLAYYFGAWIFLGVVTLDALAFTYGFDRPWLDFTTKTRLRAGPSNLRSWRGALLTAIVSFGFTVYGFALAYAALSAVDPSQFNRSLTPVRALYFAITTAATVGYGDIHPAAVFAQLLVSCQIIICFLYALLLIGVAASGATKAKRDA